MNDELKVPVLDMKVLQQKVDEFAMSAAITEIKEFYTGYNSPYRKKIKDALDQKDLSIHFDLPDILSVINEAIGKEVDQIANIAIMNTYIPMLKEFFVRAPKEIRFSEILKKFIEEQYSQDADDYSLEIEKDDKFSWLNIELSFKKNKYQFTLHHNHSMGKSEKEDSYSILSLPRTGRHIEEMTLMHSEHEIKVPFTRDILQDKFISFCASLVIQNTIIEMDTYGLDDELFREY